MVNTSSTSTANRAHDDGSPLGSQSVNERLLSAVSAINAAITISGKDTLSANKASAVITICPPSANQRKRTNHASPIFGAVATEAGVDTMK